MTVRYSTSDAVQFLQGWASEGPWVLTSIPPDKGPDDRTDTATFTAKQAEEMGGWIEDRQGKQNIYFTVNRTFRPATSKPSKADIAAAVALHVDVDPRVAEDLAKERERALRLLREYKPTPTVIIDSGGGYQGFWLLDAPVDLTGDPGDDDRHLPVEDRNLQIETVLQADSCHNIDRIMRLPGTVNLPNKKKRAAGRKPALAQVVEVDWTRLYRLDAFTPARRGVAPAGAPVAGGPVSRFSAGPVRRLNSLDDLRGVSDRTKALIVQGLEPDDPGRWEADRSDLVLHVLCDLIRADVSDDDMLAVILDRDFGVSAHVLEQPKPEPYARRQVQRALERQPRPGPIVVPVALNLARAYRDARRPHLLHHQQEFLDWDGAAYVGVADDTVRAEVWRFLETCRVEVERDGVKRPEPFTPNPDKVSATLDALRAVAHLPPASSPALRWLDGRAGPNPLDLLPTRSGLLHLPTGDLLPATPQLFTRNALDFAYDPAAAHPTSCALTAWCGPTAWPAASRRGGGQREYHASFRPAGCGQGARC